MVCWWSAEQPGVHVEASCAAMPASGRDRPPLRLTVERCGEAPDPSHKVIARGWWHEALERARDGGADDVLLVAGDGRVLETAIANVFVRLGRRVVTPPAPSCCLPGVMRRVVLDTARELGYAVEQRTVALDELASADEILLTNATSGALRVGELHSMRWSAWPLADALGERGLPAPGWFVDK